MIRKYHSKNCRQTRGTARKSHTTTTRHQEDKQSKATSSLFPIKIIAKLEWTGSDTITEYHNGSYNQQRINNNNRATDLEQTASKATGGPDAPCWYQIFALDSAVVETQTMLSSHEGFLTIAIYHYRETI